LYDLIPSAAGCDFVLRRQEQIRISNNVFIPRTLDDVVFVDTDTNMACILATDLVRFTPLSMELGVKSVVQLLNEVWSIMDMQLMKYQAKPSENPLHKTIVGQHTSGALPHTSPLQPTKMDTVGDAYVVAVLIQPDVEWPLLRSVSLMLQVARCVAEEIHAYSQQGPFGLAPGRLEMRLGMSIGQALAGVVGMLKPRYHIYGPTAHQAVLLESKSKAFHLHIDRATQEFVPAPFDRHGLLIPLLPEDDTAWPLSAVIENSCAC
jgi:class 3 adenylate cyclase